MLFLYLNFQIILIISNNNKRPLDVLKIIKPNPAPEMTTTEGGKTRCAFGVIIPILKKVHMSPHSNLIILFQKSVP